MTELGPFGLEIFLVMRIGFRADRHLLDHFQAVTLETDNFFRIIGQKAKLTHTEIEKNLRA